MKRYLAGALAALISFSSFAATTVPATMIDYSAGLTPMSGVTVPVSLFGESAGTSYLSGGGITVQDNSAHAGTGHSAYHFASRPLGTGTSGPTNADYAFTISLLKQNFNSGSAHAGELDGGYIAVRNDGSDSDTTGLLFDIGNYGTGFNAIFEGNSYKFTGNSITQGVNNQAAVVDTRSGQQYGYVVQKNYGVGGTAYFANQGAGNSGQWQHLIQLIGSGATRFDTPIDSNNVVTMKMYDSSSNSKTLGVSSNNFRILNNAGAGEILNLTDAGTLTVPGAVSSGSVSTGGLVASGQATLGSVKMLDTSSNSKTLSVVSNSLKVLNNAGSGEILSLTDAGALTVPATLSSGSVSTGGITASGNISGATVTSTGALSAGSLALTSDSSWTAYTPTLAAASGTYTTATATGAYKTIGNVVVFRVKVTVTTVGTGTFPVVGLPFAVNNGTGADSVTFAGRENAASGSICVMIAGAGSLTGQIYTYNNGNPAANGAVIYVSGSYVK
jgi:hypothetical protein